MIKISIIIPAYNEEKNIAETIRRIKNVGFEHEIIIIDDGSTDNTYQEAIKTKAKVLRHPTNHGYGASLKRGVREASGNYILIMDADLQHDGKYINKICTELISQNYDMVVGQRIKMDSSPIHRRPGKLLLALVANYLANKKIPDLNSGFRIIRKNLLESMLPILPNGFSFTTTVTLAFIKEGLSTKYIPIKVEARKGNKSHVKVISDGSNTLMLIIRTILQFNPLRVFLAH